MKNLQLTLLFLLVCLVAQAQQPKWASSFLHATSGFVRDITVDTNGNVFSVGYFYGHVTNPANTPADIFASQGEADLFFAKHNKDGELLWLNTYGGIGDDRAHSITTDGEHLYIAAMSNSPQLIRSGDTITTQGGMDGVILKLDTNGMYVWSRSFGGTDNDEAYKIEVAKDGDLLVGGYFTGGIRIPKLGGDTTEYYTTSSNPLLQRMNTQGDVLWSQRLHAFGRAYIYGLTETSEGDIWTTGHFSDKIVSPDFAEKASLGLQDVYVAQFSGDGDYEAVSTFGSSGDDVAYGLAVANGYVYLGGAFNERMNFLDNTNVPYLQSKGGRDGFILKMDDNLTILAANKFGGSATDQVYNIAATSNGIFLTGSYRNSSNIYGSTDIHYLSNQGDEDVYVSKYNETLELQWIQSLGGGYRDVATGIATWNDKLFFSGSGVQKVIFPFAKNIMEVNAELGAGGSRKLSPFVAQLQDCNFTPRITDDDGTLIVNIDSDTLEWIKYQRPLNIIAGEDSTAYKPTTTGVYAVRATKDGCSVMSNWIELYVAGISDKIAAQVSVYPNPAQNEIRISTGSLHLEQFSLTDLLGAELLRGDGQSLDISTLPSGSYVLKVTTSEGIITKKIMRM